MEGSGDPDFVARLKLKLSKLERYQKHRLTSWAPRDLLQTYFNSFSNWKAFVRTDRFALTEAKSDVPNEPVRQRMVKWIQSSQTAEEMLATVPNQRQPSDLHKREMTNGLIPLALEYAPDKAHIVLETIFRQHMPNSTYPFYLFEDTLEMLAARLHWTEGLDKRATATELADLVSLILTHTDKKFHVRPFQSTIFKILYSLPLERLQTWYGELREASCFLSTMTEFQFASRFAKSINTKLLGLEILRRLRKERRIDINSSEAESICTSLLMFTEEELETQDSSLPTPAEMFGGLREIGMNPSHFTYAAILRALCLRKDIDTAMQVADVMKNQGLEHDAFIYAILINGCRRSKTYETLADLAVEACQADIRDTVLWNDVLYAVFTACLAENKGVQRPALFPINTIYTRIFDAAPLRPFITGRIAEVGAHLVGSVKDAWFPDRLRRLEREITPLPPRELLQPGVDTLSIMIMCMLRNLPHPYDLVNFYTQFRKLLAEGHPDAERLVRERGTFVYDIILRSLVAWRGTMRIVIDIVREMMKTFDKDDAKPAVGDSQTVNYAGTATSGADEKLQTPSTTDPVIPRPHCPVRPPPPSIYTWTILVKGFMRNERPEQAEQCINLMRQHGVEPNIVTWNTLTAGYATMQHIRGTVDSMRRLEAAGFKADDWTMRAFSFIRDKRRAIQVMEETLEANKLEKEKDEQQNLGSNQPLEQNNEDLGPVEERAVEDESLDFDLDHRFHETDPGTMPTHLSEQMMDKIEHMEAGMSIPESEDDPLAQLDDRTPTTVPERLSRRYPDTVRQLQRTAPVDEKTIEHFEMWRRMRNDGLAAAPPPKSLQDVKSQGF